MSFDMNKLMEQAAQMQEQMARMQEEAAAETAEASVGGGMVKVTANGAGEVLSITISPEAIDPEDPRNVTLLSDALYDVTGRRLSLAFAVGDEDEADSAVATEAEGPAGEDAILELMKETLDAKERGES